MTPIRRGGQRAANRWQNQAQHQTAELRRVACQLRRTPAPTLALKVAAGRIEAIAPQFEAVAMPPAQSEGGGGGSISTNALDLDRCASHSEIFFRWRGISSFFGSWQSMATELEHRIFSYFKPLSHQGRIAS